MSESKTDKTYLKDIAKIVDDNLSIEVLDNGVGIGDTGTESGLANLRRRAADCHGVFSVAARDTGGTALLWSAALP